jgi:hypothetical protein
MGGLIDARESKRHRPPLLFKKLAIYYNNHSRHSGLTIASDNNPGDVVALATRAGRYVRQPRGYRAFIPTPLPPEPPIAFDAGLLRELSRADQALGRLDRAVQTLPNPDLFLAM